MVLIAPSTTSQPAERSEDARLKQLFWWLGLVAAMFVLASPVRIYQIVWYETPPFAAKIVLCVVSRCPADAPTQLRKIELPTWW